MIKIYIETSMSQYNWPKINQLEKWATGIYGAVLSSSLCDEHTPTV